MNDVWIPHCPFSENQFSATIAMYAVPDKRRTGVLSRIVPNEPRPCHDDDQSTSVDSTWAADYFSVNPEERKLRYQADLFPELDPPARRDREISAGVEGYFWGPSAVMLDDAGRLYIADSLRHRLQVYLTN